MIVATAGHIDHGKTTLVRALTGVDTDRLPEEKARGISIDLGFAYWRPDSGQVIGFVDVPGHERFVRNMLAGVCGVDYVLLVVAADDGVKPQTVEHLSILDLLGLERGLAVITKADRVAPARVAEVEGQIRNLLGSSSLAGIPVLAVSATTGEGMDALRAKLAQALAEHARRTRDGRLFRFAVDRVFTVAGAGTVVTGTVFDGSVAAGERLLVSPAGLEVRVRGLQKDGRSTEGAAAGERCALNLAGVEHSALVRGDWIVHPSLHAPTQRLDVRVRVLAGEARPLDHWTPVHVHLGAADVTGRVGLRRGARVSPGTSSLAQLVLDRPIAALAGDRFVLRDQSALRTLGGGRVVDPFARRGRKRAHEAARLEAMEHEDPEQALGALLGALPGGVDLAHFARSFCLAPEAMQALAAKAGVTVLGKEPPLGLAGGHAARLKDLVLAALERFHAEAPQKSALAPAHLREQCAPELTAEAFGHLLRRLAEDEAIELSGAGARLPRHVATGNPADETAWQKVRPELERAGVRGLTVAELAAAVRMKEKVLADFLHRKAATGELVRVTPERFYLRATLDELAAAAQSAARAAPQGKFTAAQFRDRIGLGRGRAIEILECLDRLRITQRIGDVRVVRSQPGASQSAAKNP